MENDDVTVLMVWNGPGVGQKWQLQSVLRTLKRQRGEESEDEDENENDKEVSKKAKAPRNGAGAGARTVVKAEKSSK